MTDESPAARTRKTTPRSEADLQAWKTWKENPTDENLQVVFDALKGAKMQMIRKWSGAPLPAGALEGHANVLVMAAIKKFDPDRANLSTHVHNYLKGLDGFVKQHQNIGRIPTKQAQNIGNYKRAVESLVEEYGYIPETKVIAESMGWSVKQVTRLQTMQRPDLIASAAPEEEPMSFGNTRDQDMFDFFHDHLKEKAATGNKTDKRDLAVFELTFKKSPGDLDQKPPPGPIAQELKTSTANIYRSWNRLRDQLRDRGF